MSNADALLLFQVSQKPEKKRLLISSPQRLYCTCANEESWNHPMLMSFNHILGIFLFRNAEILPEKAINVPIVERLAFVLTLKIFLAFTSGKEMGKFTPSIKNNHDKHQGPSALQAHSGCLWFGDLFSSLPGIRNSIWWWGSSSQFQTFVTPSVLCSQFSYVTRNMHMWKYESFF